MSRTMTPRSFKKTIPEDIQKKFDALPKLPKGQIYGKDLEVGKLYYHQGKNSQDACERTASREVKCIDKDINEHGHPYPGSPKIEFTSEYSGEYVTVCSRPETIYHLKKDTLDLDSPNAQFVAYTAKRASGAPVTDRRGNVANLKGGIMITSEKGTMEERIANLLKATKIDEATAKKMTDQVATDRKGVRKLLRKLEG